MPTRGELLYSSVERFNKIHNEWAGAGDNSSPYPTLTYWGELQEMVRVFEEGDLPAESRVLATHVFRLAKEFAIHDGQDAVEPHQEFWRARQDLEQYHSQMNEPGTPRHRESMQQLRDQKVPDEQIARMWGLKNPDGTGKSYLVQREIDNPGSVIGPDYVHPDDVEATRNAKLAMSSWLEEKQKLDDIVGERKEQETRTPCKETSHDLWSLPHMSVKQAAKMLCREEGDVAREWEGFKRQKEQSEQEKKESPQPPSAISDASPVEDAAVEPVAVDAPDSQNEDAGDKSEEYERFSEWEYQQLLNYVRDELDIEITGRGRKSREWLIDQILEAENSGVELTEEEDVGV